MQIYSFFVTDNYSDVKRFAKSLIYSDDSPLWIFSICLRLSKIVANENDYHKVFDDIICLARRICPTSLFEILSQLGHCCTCVRHKYISLAHVTIIFANKICNKFIILDYNQCVVPNARRDQKFFFIMKRLSDFFLQKQESWGTMCYRPVIQGRV